MAATRTTQPALPPHYLSSQKTAKPSASFEPDKPRDTSRDCSLDAPPDRPETRRRKRDELATTLGSSADSALRANPSPAEFVHQFFDHETTYFLNRHM